MDTIPPGNRLPLAGDLVIRTRVLELRCKRLIRRQIDFAAFCRAQAAALTRDAAECRFPDLRAILFRIALHYDRIAASAEQLVGRFEALPGDGAPDDGSPAPPRTAEAA
jgi:hypothetical protein